MPCSTSNLGAGFDAIGLALDRYLEARYEPGGGELRIERGGSLAGMGLSADEDLLVRAFRGRLDALGVGEARGTIHMTSDIPLGRGLGSSAAATVGGMVLAEAVLGREERPREPGARGDLLAEACAIEGHPDNVAPALFGGLVAVARGEGGSVRAIPLRLSERIAWAYAAPGFVLSTRVARATLPAWIPHRVAARALGRVAALVEGLATGEPELLRAGFEDELHVPYRLALIPGAQAALGAATEAGAWATTISGAGSGLIAASPPERAEAVAEAMGAAFRREAGEEGVVAFTSRPDFLGAAVHPAAR